VIRCADAGWTSDSPDRKNGHGEGAGVRADGLKGLSAIEKRGLL